jgi:hypothetical protein
VKEVPAPAVPASVKEVPASVKESLVTSAAPAVPEIPAVIPAVIPEIHEASVREIVLSSVAPAGPKASVVNPELVKKDYMIASVKNDMESMNKARELLSAENTAVTDDESEYSDPGLDD